MWIYSIITTALVTSVVYSQNFRCPTIDGFYPHPIDCDKYYQCANKNGTQFQCAPGTFWSARTFVCSWPNDVPDCDYLGKRARHTALRGNVTSEQNIGVTKGDDKAIWTTDQQTQVTNQTTTRHTLTSLVSSPYVPDTFVATGESSTTIKASPAEVTDVVTNSPAVTNTATDQTEVKFAARNYFTEFQCPKLFGFHRDPYNCRSYFHCLNGVPYKRFCPTDRYYDTRTFHCSRKSDVKGCLFFGNVGADIELFKPVTKGLVLFDCPKDYGYYPDLSDCSYYFECIHRNPYRRQCMHGTLFDRVRHKCTWENLVRDCANLSPVGDLTTRAPQEVDKSFKCPHSDGYFRFPDDCTKYYHCIDDNAILLRCEHGSHFDIDIGKCSWSNKVAGCDNNNNKQVPVLIVHQHEQKEQKELAKRPVLNQGKLSYRSFKCPEQEGYFRDLEDCSVYYYCTKWKVFQQQCKPGTVFSMTKLTCTWPRLVTDCNNGFDNATKRRQPHQQASKESFETVDMRLKEEPVVPANKPGNIITQHEEGLPDINSITEAASISFVCPPVFDGYYGDPILCSKFYRCIAGKMYSFNCPQGTYFDNILFLCNFMSEVTDCTNDGMRENVIQQRDEYLESPDYHQHEDYDIVETGESPRDYSIPDFNAVQTQCPQRDGVFAHSGSCNKFIHCNKYTPKMIACPGDLLYNIHIHSCDYPDNVICKLYD